MKGVGSWSIKYILTSPDFVRKRVYIMIQEKKFWSFTVTVKGLMEKLNTSVNILSHEESLKNELKSYSALWDTGATRTSISKKVVEELNLSHLDCEPIISHTSNGDTYDYLYLVNITLPMGVRIFPVIENSHIKQIKILFVLPVYFSFYICII